MDINEMNILIATGIFNLKLQVDFGTWEDHVWKRDNSGVADMFAWDDGRHSGPTCIRCGYSYCDYCQDGPDEPCEIELPDYTNYYNIGKLLDELGKQVTINIIKNSEYTICTLSGIDESGCKISIESCDVEFTKAICLSAARWVEKIKV